ncbi:MAG: ABC transporter substrate-binding protein [Succinatimonas sp.]|nr:ABC transporter substrate-binding protein [Succinatimonas sp.]
MKIFKTVIVATVMLMTSFMSYAKNDNPYETANAIAVQTFDDLKTNRERLHDNNVVIGIIKKDLLPYVDVRYAAYKVIGTSLKQTSKEERDAFTEAFGDYMMRSMSNALSKYSNQELKVSPVSDVPADTTIVSVKYTVTQNGAPDINFVVKMRLNKKSGEWKAFDLIAENISILDAKQAELSPVIRDKGISEAINLLKKAKVSE